MWNGIDSILNLTNQRMNGTIRSVITGTGSYIPGNTIANDSFLTREFYESNGARIQKSNREIIDKFLDITTIAERRYADDDMLTSDMATLAAQVAIDAFKNERRFKPDIPIPCYKLAFSMRCNCTPCLVNSST